MSEEKSLLEDPKTKSYSELQSKIEDLEYEILELKIEKRTSSNFNLLSYFLIFLLLGGFISNLVISISNYQKLDVTDESIEFKIKPDIDYLTERVNFILGHLDKISAKVNRMETPVSKIDIMRGEMAWMQSLVHPKFLPPCLDLDHKTKEMKFAKQGDCELLTKNGTSIDANICYIKSTDGYIQAGIWECQFFF